MTPSKREKAVVYLILASILFATLGYILTSAANRRADERLKNTPVDVLTDWHLCTTNYNEQTKQCDPDSKQYMPGDVIQVTSKFTKLINVKGNPERYIQCHKLNSSEWDGLVLSNRGQGTSLPVKNGKSVYGVGIPLNVGSLPNTCRVCPIITYNVNKYHEQFQEKMCSNEFQIIPRPGVVQVDDRTYIYTTEPSKATDTPASLFPVIQPQNTTLTVNPSNEQEASPATETERPGLVERLINSTSNLIGKIL